MLLRPTLHYIWQQGNCKNQTPPPVWCCPGESVSVCTNLCQIFVATWRVICLYTFCASPVPVQIHAWRHPQNRKYIIKISQRYPRGPSVGHREHARKIIWSLDVWFLTHASVQTDIQTDRHDHHNTQLPYLGRVNVNNPSQCALGLGNSWCVVKNQQRVKRLKPRSQRTNCAELTSTSRPNHTLAR